MRSGWLAANSAAIGPPSSDPTTAARSEPAAFITASTSSICSSSVGAPSIGSDSPEPRRSNTITLPNEAIRSNAALIVGSRKRYSHCEIQVGTQRMSSGPSP